MHPEMHSASPPSTGKKRKLRFRLESNEVRHILHLQDLREEEVRAVWYAREDYEQIKMTLIPVIKKMMRGETIEESNEMSSRGLEFRTREGALRRQKNKMEAWTAVLDEQDRQVSAGLWDEEQLAKVYSTSSAKSRERAGAFGQLDAAVARSLVTAEDEDLQRKSSEATKAKKKKLSIRLSKLMRPSVLMNGFALDRRAVVGPAA